MKLRLHLLVPFIAILAANGPAFAQAAQAQPAAPQQQRPAAPPPAPTTAEDKAALNYALGYQLGIQLAQSGETFDLATVQRGLQDAYAKKEPAHTREKMGQLFGGFEQRMAAKQAAEMERAVNENRAKSQEFLNAFKAQGQGVVTLPSGIMYSVREAGTGAKPTAASNVEIQYQSLIMPIGIPFDEVRQPATVKLSEIPYAGLREVLPQIAAGSLVQIAFPPGKAATGQGTERLNGQAVLMNVRLVSVK